MTSDYEGDILQWSDYKGLRIRARCSGGRVAAGESVNDQIDWPNMINEVKTVGRSERTPLRTPQAA